MPKSAVKDLLCSSTALRTRTFLTFIYADIHRRMPTIYLNPDSDSLKREPLPNVLTSS